MIKTSLILLSGGLDSAVSFLQALKNTNVKLALTFDYGQKSALPEISAAQKLAQAFNIPHQILKIDFLKTDTHPFFSQNKAPTLKISELDNESVSQKTAKAVWVPNRNGVFLNIAASLCEQQDIDQLVVGFNKEEAQTFPDNSRAYLEALNHAFEYSTQNSVQVVAPTLDWDKSQMVAWLLKNDFDFSNLWSCYDGQNKMCGQCESCKRFQRALMVHKQTHWIQKLFMTKEV